MQDNQTSDQQGTFPLTAGELSELSRLQLARENLALRSQLLAAEEWKFVAGLCNRLGLPLQTLNIDPTRGIATRRDAKE